MSHHLRAGVSRRRVLKGAAAGMFGAAGAAVLAACGETQVVTKEVIKEVPVETVVTREVVKEVPVETVVTKEVVKEVAVEKLVTTEVVKQVEVVKEVPVEVEKIVTKEIIKEVQVEAPMMIPEGPISGGTLRHSAGGGNTQDIFNPLKQVSSSQAYITDYVFLPLWYGNTWGPGDTPAMTGEWDVGVANSWDEVERGRVYNFHINPDVKWHDGLPVTADDVLFGTKMGLDKNYGSGQHKKAWGRIEGAEAWGENPTDNVEDVPGLTKLDEMTSAGRDRPARPGLVGEPRLAPAADGPAPLRGSGAGDSARDARHSPSGQRPDDLEPLRLAAVRRHGGEHGLRLRRAVRRRLRRALRRPDRLGRGHGGRRAGLPSGEQHRGLPAPRVACRTCGRSRSARRSAGTCSSTRPPRSSPT